MRDGIYSPLKVFHHRGRIDAMREGKRPDLLHVQLVVTNRCNQNCEFCAYRSHGYSSSEDFHVQDQIPFVKVAEIVEDCERLGVRAIELTGGGEPTVHESFPEICRTIEGFGIDYSVVTNGSHLSEDAMAALSRAKWVRFSMDAGTESTYAMIRHTSPLSFARVRQNIRTLRDIRGQAIEPTIGVGFVIANRNWHEVLYAVRNAKNDGADNFRISAVFQNGGADYFRDFHAHARELCEEARALNDAAFTVFDLFGDRLDDLSQQSPSCQYCPLQQLITYVGADQCVYRCCVLAYSEAGLLGSLKDRRLAEMWSSDEVAVKIASFDARRCPRCMFNRKNRTIRYAIDGNPPHVNFL